MMVANINLRKADTKGRPGRKKDNKRKLVSSSLFVGEPDAVLACIVIRSPQRKTVHSSTFRVPNHPGCIGPNWTWHDGQAPASRRIPQSTWNSYQNQICVISAPSSSSFLSRINFVRQERRPVKNQIAAHRRPGRTYQNDLLWQFHWSYGKLYPCVPIDHSRQFRGQKSF